MSQIRFEEKTYNTDSLDISLWKRILKLLSSQKHRLIRLGILNLFIALVDVLLPYMNKVAIDVFAAGRGTDTQLVLFILLFAGGGILQALMVYFYFIEAGHTEMDMAYELRESLFSKLQSLSYSYFDVTPAGWLLSRLTGDVTRLSEILAWSLMDLAWGVSVMLGVTGVMLVTDWKLALLVLAVVPLLAVLANWFNIRILKNYRDVRRINSKITSSFNEGIMGARTTKTLVLEDTNFSEFKGITGEMESASVRAATLSSLFYPTVMMLSAFSLAAILVYGGHQVFLQVIRFGTLMMFTEYARKFFEPLNQIASLIAELQMAQASAERVLSLLDEQPAIRDRQEVVARYGTELEPKEDAYEPMIGKIEFDHVSFHYGEGEEILHDFCLSVNPGETVALVGETGSGKSTIVNLLCRFYEPASGRILIDGRDYRERSIGWLHSRIGYVLQSPHLFSGSIRDNVRFGRLDATDEEIKAACRLVNADAFIRQLDKGYDTEVGEGGGRLSTGQKQLISFARAVIADPGLFILDEATSSVDTETEQIIQAAVDTVMKGRTSFIVAHRLSTIVNADKILVINKGRIIEQGTHQELMAMKGDYYNLYVSQFNEEATTRILGTARTYQIDDEEE
ncbi:MAG: ABC transporter ATP-binding protein [Solobacterium sp.]|nr:ABC transporter ATP-binding protein [Solobacterium sp.]MBQ6531572.1 ABC transporter ATP-binding protein [Solobacterium sp.]